DALLKAERQQRRTQRQRHKGQWPLGSERILPLAPVELSLEVDKYLTDLMFDVQDSIELIDGVLITLSDILDESPEIRTLVVAFDKHVGIRRASSALADWLERAFLRPGSAVRVNHTLVDARTPSLRKLLAGKIARRRLAA